MPYISSLFSIQESKQNALNLIFFASKNPYADLCRHVSKQNFENESRKMYLYFLKKRRILKKNVNSTVQFKKISFLNFCFQFSIKSSAAINFTVSL